MRKMLCVLLVLLASMFTVKSANAQTCPSGKTAFVWMNGIHGVPQTVNGVTTPGDIIWANTVKGISVNYIATHPTLDPNCIKFVAVFNHSGYFTEDLAQASAQWISQAIKQVDFSDSDFVALIDMIRLYSGNGYRVVLVGHSQGTFYTNFAYEAIRDKKVFPIPTIPSLPDPTKLSIVNIASASNHVADGNGRYTTQCGDIMYIVPGSLPSNINNDGSAGCPAGLGVHPVDIHQLDAYLAPRSQTQLQIYADLDLAANLPDSGCFGDSNCYLKDSFRGDYIINWRQFGDMKLAEGSTIDTASHLGTLQLTSYNNYTTVLTGPGIASAPARLSLRSRRVFTGPFTASLQYNVAVRSGDGFTHISLNNASDGSLGIGLSAVKTGWRNLVFTKTDTQISLSVDGVLLGSNPSGLKDGYYLEFDLQGNNTLQIQNLSVVRTATTPPLPLLAMTLTPATNTVSVVQGSSASVDLTLKSQNGMTGNPTLQLYCMQVCPANFSYNFPQGSATNLPANGSIPIHLVFSTNASATPGTYNFQYWSTLSGITVKAVIAVIVTAKPVNAPGMTLTPVSTTVSVVRGNPITVNLTLASQGGMTGNPTITLYCSGTCPAGFIYNYTSGSTRTLLANGTLPISATFTPSSSAVLGTSNFAYWTVLNGVTVKATIAITVTAPTTTTGTIVVSTTGSVATSCVLSGVAITAPVTLANQTVGTKSLGCTAPSGYTLNSVSPTSQNLSAGGTASFTVALTKVAAATGMVIIKTNGTVSSISCTLNGTSVTGPITFSNQAVGTKILSCTPPTGFTLTSITPSSSQTLSAGGTVTFTVNLASPTPVLSGISVITNPKVNTNITVYLTGSGFVNGMLAYVCTSSSTSSCTSTPFTLVSNSQVNLYSVRSSVATTLYLRVVNSAGVWSNYKTMVVIN